MATTSAVGCRISCDWCWEVAEYIDILVASSVIDRRAGWEAIIKLQEFNLKALSPSGHIWEGTIGR
jgi:uncharacterized Fe-S cluster-containing radical SAM superfamily protein